MKKSKKRKFVLLELVSSCEYYNLNEKEALGFINNFLDNRTICRRTYYNYKKQVYEKESEDKIFQMKLNRYAPKSFRNVADILFDKGKLKQEYRNSLTDYLIFNEFSKQEKMPKYYKYLYARGDAIIKNTQKLSTDLTSRTDTAKSNFSLIPDNATVRKEYVKCRNYYCNSCPHGPYYYGYWKDRESGKLKKKYIGRWDPTERESNNRKSLLETVQNLDKS